MPKVELSDRFIATLKPQATGALDYFDTKAKGLNLRVTPTGVKAWSVMFTSPRDGKRARLSLGTYPATSLAKARGLAIEARGHVESGVDPRDFGRRSTAGAMTVGMLAADYMARHATKLRSYAEVRRKLHSDILPVIGDVNLSHLHRRDVHRVLDPIKDRGSAAAARKVFTELRAMLNWAVARGLLDHNPAAAMQEDDGGKARERYLTEDEIALLWPALSKLKRPVELALKLALVTGQRIGEVCGMTEDEIDLTNGSWTIPAERSKNGEAHTIPLTVMALQLISECEPINGRLINRSPAAIAQALHYGLHDKRKPLPIQGWTAHDLRRTACTHMAKLGIPPLHIAAVANHRQVTKRGVTLGVYVQYDYAKEKREALELWADRLQGIVSGAAPLIAIRRA